MILIADSGSTKTDWCVVENGQPIQQISTKGPILECLSACGRCLQAHSKNS